MTVQQKWILVSAQQNHFIQFTGYFLRMAGPEIFRRSIQLFGDITGGVKFQICRPKGQQAISDLTGLCDLDVILFDVIGAVVRRGGFAVLHIEFDLIFCNGAFG